MVKAALGGGGAFTSRLSVAPLTSTLPVTATRSNAEMLFRSARRVLPAPRARLPMLSVPAPVPAGETVPPVRPVTDVALPVGPVPASVPAAVTSNPFAAVTARGWVPGRLRVVTKVAGLVPALIVTGPVSLSGNWALIATPPPAPVAVRVTAPPSVVTGPATVSTPGSVARATVAAGRPAVVAENDVLLTPTMLMLPVLPRVVPVVVAVTVPALTRTGREVGAAVVPPIPMLPRPNPAVAFELPLASEARAVRLTVPVGPASRRVPGSGPRPPCRPPAVPPAVLTVIVPPLPTVMFDSEMPPPPTPAVWAAALPALPASDSPVSRTASAVAFAVVIVDPANMSSDWPFPASRFITISTVPENPAPPTIALAFRVKSSSAARKMLPDPVETTVVGLVSPAGPTIRLCPPALAVTTWTFPGPVAIADSRLKAVPPQSVQ